MDDESENEEIEVTAAEVIEKLEEVICTAKIQRNLCSSIIDMVAASLSS